MSAAEVSIKSIVATGYANSQVKDFLILSGGTGLEVDPVIFDRHYSFFSIWCEDLGGVAGSTKMMFRVAYTEEMEPVTLYQQNQPGTIWQSTDNLPTSGGLSFQLTEAIGILKLQIILDQATVDDVHFHIIGIKQAAN